MFPQMYVNVTESVPGTTVNATCACGVVGVSAHDKTPASVAIAKHTVIRVDMVCQEGM